MSDPIATERSSRTAPCNLCHETHFELISRRDRRSDPLKTVICRNCGLVSHESIPSDKEVDAYYATEYRNDYHGEHAPSAHRIIRAWEGAQWLLNLLRPYVPSGSKVFEVGAGIGFNVKAFELDGYSASGIEPGHGFQQFSRQALKAKIGRESLSDQPQVPRYDFVLLVHVIEHFNSPRQALQHIHKILEPNGRLYVECPNLAEPHAAPSKLFHFAHIYNFTPETLVSLAQSCGFQVTACLTEQQGRALRYVFQKSEHSKLKTQPEAYAKTMASLNRFSDFTYHARPRYVMHRIRRDIRFASNHCFAKVRVKRLLKRMQQGSEQKKAAALIPGNRPATASH
ncbi:MAG: class I SAM-dependent methyltransferase [Planctomycetaceae bacterium]|nr:class I SAM-dependent methyltransferase [Planctomycetaceae bacterium]